MTRIRKHLAEKSAIVKVKMPCKWMQKAWNFDKCDIIYSINAKVCYIWLHIRRFWFVYTHSTVCRSAMKTATMKIGHSILGQKLDRPRQACILHIQTLNHLKCIWIIHNDKHVNRRKMLSLAMVMQLPNKRMCLKLWECHNKDVQQFASNRFSKRFHET